MDTPNVNRPAYTLSRKMPWAEKAYVMEAIDYLQPSALREGGRAAYMAFLGCKSWVAEMWRVKHMLGAQGWRPTNFNHLGASTERHLSCMLSLSRA